MNHKFSSFKPLDYAIVLSAIGLNFIKLVPYGIVIVFFAWIYELFVSKSMSLRHQWNSNRKLFLIFITPFSLAILGLIITSNYSKGLEDLGRLLPFLIFPALFVFIKNERIEKLSKFVLFGFVVGLFIRFFLDFWESAVGFTYDYNFQIFFYSYLDSDPNILAILTMFAILFLLDYSVTKAAKITKKEGIILMLCALFLSLCVLLLQSRIVILFFFFGLLSMFLYHWRKKQKWTIFIVLTFSSLLMLTPAFQGRFQVVASETKQLNEPSVLVKNDTTGLENLNCMSSTELRYNSLKASWEIVKRNPIFGVGTGDWRDELMSEYVHSTMPCNAHEQTAPHNQYMRTMLKYGFIGLIIYLIYLFLLFKISRNRYRFGQIPFLLTLVLCGLGYDLVDVGSSAPVFAFFSTWLFLDKRT